MPFILGLVIMGYQKCYAHINFKYVVENSEVYNEKVN